MPYKVIPRYGLGAKNHWDSIDTMIGQLPQSETYFPPKNFFQLFAKTNLASVVPLHRMHASTPTMLSLRDCCKAV